MARIIRTEAPEPLSLAIRSAHATLTLAALDRANARPHAATGPGWFDSSWDLQRGLEVREGLPEDASLDEWLVAACLRG